MIRFLKSRKDREDQEEDLRLSKRVRAETKEELAKTPEIAALTRKLVEARARNHFVEQLTLGFNARTREV